MTADELLHTMQAVLEAEREGIRRFDGAAVARANEAKEDVLRRLRETPPAARGPLLAVLDQLQPALRCNLILLTQARALVREAKAEAEAEAAARAAADTTNVVPLVRRKAG